MSSIGRMSGMNRQIRLKSRPSGAPTPDNFDLVDAPMPVAGDGEVLRRTLYLSIDPYMRGRMSDAPSYAPPVEIGAVMIGATVSRVESSRHPAFTAGELVLAAGGWQDYSLSDGSGLRKLPTDLPQPARALGVL